VGYFGPCTHIHTCIPMVCWEQGDFHRFYKTRKAILRTYRRANYAQIDELPALSECVYVCERYVRPCTHVHIYPGSDRSKVIFIVFVKLKRHYHAHIGVLTMLRWMRSIAYCSAYMCAWGILDHAHTYTHVYPGSIWSKVIFIDFPKLKRQYCAHTGMLTTLR
jgi:hypothetical protein